MLIGFHRHTCSIEHVRSTVSSQSELAHPLVHISRSLRLRHLAHDGARLVDATTVEQNDALLLGATGRFFPVRSLIRRSRTRTTRVSPQTCCGVPMLAFHNPCKLHLFHHSLRISIRTSLATFLVRCTYCRVSFRLHGSSCRPRKPPPNISLDCNLLAENNYICLRL